MGEQSVDEQLEQMTGNPRVARAIIDALRQMRAGAAGPDFADMASDLLEGRVGLRDLGNTEAYGRQFRDAFARFTDWEAGQEPADLTRMREETRAKLEDEEPGR